MQTVESYLNLSYHTTVVQDASGDAPAWVAWVNELVGCISQGDTREEALEMLDEAMRLWFEVALEQGQAIPPPYEEPEYSGKLMVRLPRGLHRTLALGAKREGISLNQYLGALLAGAVGWRQPDAGGDHARRASA